MSVSDEYVLELVRRISCVLAGGHCEFPGCYETICDPHHWLSKKNLSIRYDPQACIYLCTEHHTAGAHSAHRAPAYFKNIIIESGVRSQEWADQVNLKKNRIITIQAALYREDCKKLLLRELERMAA